MLKTPIEIIGVFLLKIKVVCYNIEQLKGMDYLNTLPNIELTKKGIDILEETTYPSMSYSGKYLINYLEKI